MHFSVILLIACKDIKRAYRNKYIYYSSMTWNGVNRIVQNNCFGCNVKVMQSVLENEAIKE